MDDKLLIITKIKKSVQYVDKFLENYNRNEQTLRDKTKEELYDLLKDTYLANILERQERINKQKEVLVHIKMLNFYLDSAYKKQLISSKQYTNIGKHMLDVFIMTKAWIKSNQT
ncbi:MAG: four helix bundle protein [Firmicutes bacterium]|nr:four helix bundle protein [Bacillota bacterium]